MLLLRDEQGLLRVGLVRVLALGIRRHNRSLRKEAPAMTLLREVRRDGRLRQVLRGTRHDGGQHR